MKNAIITIFAACGLFLVSTTSYSQNFFKNTFIAGNIALADQDRRLFDHPQTSNLLRLDYNHVDFTLGITMHKSIVMYRFMQITFGVGYMQFSSSFPRPFDHPQLTGIPTDEARIVKVYRVDQLVLPFSCNIYLNAKKSLFLNTVFRPAFTLSKSATDRVFEKRAYKWHPEFGGLEILPGLGAKFGQRWWVNINYRWYYKHRLDKVIFYSGLFRGAVPEFLKKKYDTYNPFQMQLTVGYLIKV